MLEITQHEDEQKLAGMRTQTSWKENFSEDDEG